MGKKTFIMLAVSALVLVAFLAGILIFDRTQTAKEQAYLATATVYTPPATTATAPPPTTAPVMAAAFSITDEDGKVYTLQDFAGKPVVLCFWNGSAADTSADLPMWETVQQDYADDVHLVVVHVNNEKAGSQAARKILREENCSFPPYFDRSGDAARAYGIEKFPVTYFIDAQGEIKARANSSISAGNLQIGLERIGIPKK